MKKSLSILAALVLFVSMYAATPPVSLPVNETPPVVSPLNANDVMLPVGNTGKKISLMELSTIGVKDFETLSGKKLGFFDKIGFKLGQKKLRSKLEADGTIKSSVVKKYANKMAADGETGFHLGGFALGFLLGLIGVIIAYVIKDEKKKNRVKWAWIGLAAYVAILILVLAL